MEKDPLEIILEIIEKVKSLPEQYRVDAFRILLDHQLKFEAGVIEEKSTGFTKFGEEISFSEFLIQLGALNTNMQRFAAVASYYERYRQQSSVTQEEIVNTMSDAGLRPPANFSRDMRLAASARSALLMSAREPKNGAPAWQLTITGRSFIEQRIEQNK